MRINSKSLPEDLSKSLNSENVQVRQLDQANLLHDDIQVDNLYSNINKVPQKTIYGHDLKRLKSFKKIRQSYKKKLMKQVFTSDLKVILNEY